MADGRCPCGSGRGDVECCRPIVDGERDAVTAEELMRSRYAAFVWADIDHLTRSWASSTRPATIHTGGDREWIGLEIVDVVEGRSLDRDGVVEFVAHYRDPAGPGELRERSRFVREAGRWVYLDGGTGGAALPLFAP